MLGQKSIAVVLTALLLTGLAGYFLNFEGVERTGYTYEKITDLDPVFSSVSVPSVDYERYTGPYTVTAWSPAGLIPTSSVANGYLITPTVEDYVRNTVSWKESDHAILTGEAYDGQIWRTTKDGVYYTTGGMSDGSTVYGGGGGTSAVGLWTTVLSYNVLDTDQPSAWATVAVSITDVIGDISLVDGLRITINPSWWEGSGLQLRALYDYDYLDGYKEPDRFKRYTPTWTGTPYALSSTYTWSEPLQQWVDADGVSADNILFFRVDPTGYTAKTLVASVDTPIVTTAIYADPTKLLDITEETDGATWSAHARNPTIVSGIVTMLLRLNWAEDVIYIDVGDTRVMVDYDGTGADASAWMTIDDTEIPLGRLGAYKGYIITFNGVEGRVDVSGIVQYENALSYTALDGTIASSEFPTGAIDSITVTADAGGCGVRILDTYIQTDPSGLLWHDPDVDLSAYLPGDIDALRIVMGGWVATGDAVVVNGTHYPVEDGRISVPYVDQGAMKTRTMAVSGLTIDYWDGRVSISDTGGTAVDLGDVSDRHIGLIGTWYGSVTADRIDETTVTGYELANEWNMTVNQVVLMWIGLTMVGTAICLAVKRDSWGIIDWAVVGVSLLIGLLLIEV